MHTPASPPGCSCRWRWRSPRLALQCGRAAPNAAAAPSAAAAFSCRPAHPQRPGPREAAVRALRTGAHPPVHADSGAAAVPAPAAPPPVLANAAAAAVRLSTGSWLRTRPCSQMLPPQQSSCRCSARCRPCSHGTRFLFIGAPHAFAAAAGFSSAAALWNCACTLTFKGRACVYT